MSAVVDVGEAETLLMDEFGEPAVLDTVVVTLPLLVPRLAVIVRVCAMLLRNVVRALPFALVASVEAPNVSPEPELVSAMFAPCTTFA